MSSSKKKKDGYVMKKSDIDFYKMTGVFALACIFIFLALKMQSSRILPIESGKDLTYNFYMFCRTPLFFVIAGVLLFGSALWFAISKVKKIDESMRVFTSTNCLAIVLYLAFFAGCFGLPQTSTNHGFFITATVISAVLYYVSKLFQSDFVMYSVVTALFCAAIYLFALSFEVYAVVFKCLFIVVMAAACIYFGKKIDSLKVSKKKKASFLKFPLYIPLVLGAIFLFWPLIQNMEFLTKTDSETVQAIYRFIFLNRSKMLMIMMIQYIVFAIVYTVRRIKD